MNALKGVSKYRGKEMLLITDSTSKVNAGTALVDQAAKTMDEIVASVKRVTDIMSEIAAASHEKNFGIMQIDEVTEQNAALVEQAAAETLAQQTHHLMDSISIFKVNKETGARPKIVEAPKGSVETAGSPSRLQPGVVKLRPSPTKAASSNVNKSTRTSPQKKWRAQLQSGKSSDVCSI